MTLEIHFGRRWLKKLTRPRPSHRSRDKNLFSRVIRNRHREYNLSGWSWDIGLGITTLHMSQEVNHVVTSTKLLKISYRFILYKLLNKLIIDRPNNRSSLVAIAIEIFIKLGIGRRLIHIWSCCYHQAVSHPLLALALDCWSQIMSYNL